MSKFDLTAQSAFNAQRKEDGRPVGETAKFVCPHNDCRTYAVHHWGFVSGLRVDLGSAYGSRHLGEAPVVSMSRCEACGRESIYVGGEIVLPSESDAPPSAADMPTDLVEDYEEARAILPRSPRGSAALLRLVIQKLLPHLGASKKGIDQAIGELVASGKIKTPIQKALDTVRVIGNESVHPGEMNLKDDRETALALFRIINLIIETAITEPKRLEALYASLPKSKLEGIANRDTPRSSDGANP
ncbi:DUF4145 domain-containing protein [Sphingomonas sp. NSE70-1]|uniref:DUF4145 domain-containing protein n=1 Tax=Sphingomonas caseinilyticus TaxID=2908205 RepID=A0ABT0RW21_9SPHN|nr:DUF4145 domain-containing protein [Sphingomonas caseinilyticus]MCL6699146.1 DUF4145 domain-containing protein [Sphingomonas caseinilyticus]